MPDTQQEQPVDLGRFPRSAPGGEAHPSDVAAAVLCLVWIATVAAYFIFAPDGTGPIGAIMAALVVFLPLALIWVSATTARSIRALREEAARLQASVDAMRNAYVAQGQAAAVGVKPSVEKKLEEIAAAQRQTELALTSFVARRDALLAAPAADRKAAPALQRAPAVDEQPALALGTPAEDLGPPLTVADFIRALNFPESPDDKAGFRALRLALEDRNTSRLVRAAQDVLTLLSQDGIYMDDLRPDRAKPEIWRRFAKGERGRSIAGLGGVRDRSSLALTAARMREDTVFRDAAHHFLRTFDKTFQDFEPNASDQDLADLAETRTARAFMLFGRVTGTFD